MVEQLVRAALPAADDTLRIYIDSSGIVASIEGTRTCVVGHTLEEALRNLLRAMREEKTDDRT